MGKSKSRKGKGSYAKYRTERRDEKHKATREARLERQLAKRKAKRLEKYQNLTVKDVSGTTRRLFKKWTGDEKWNRKGRKSL